MDPQATSDLTWRLMRGLVVLLVSGAFAAWLMIRALRRSEDPPRLVFKWVLTAGMLWILIRKVAPIVASGGLAAALIGIPLTAVCGMVLAIIWARSISAIAAKPLSSLYDGGDEEPEQGPFYSIAHAKRMRGLYAEAVAEVRKQLDRFPDDVEGQLLLAEIQAENLNDLEGAELTIRRLCQRPGLLPRNTAAALNSLADWHLKLAQDPEGARRALEKIIELLPESEYSALAAQRIAHLAKAEHLLSRHDIRPIAIKPGIENVGLFPEDQQPKAPEVDPARLATEYVRHLQAHPMDTEVREKLALLYADHYGRLNLAADELEQLISDPHQPPKRVVHWLNLLADLQIRHGAGYDAARQTLQRIIDLYPGSAAAQVARNRIDLLKLELKRRDAVRSVRLGEYEQDIGLKRGLPHKP